MFTTLTIGRRLAGRPASVWAAALSAALLAANAAGADDFPPMEPSQVVRNISQANERIEMTVNTSQILTLGSRIPRMVVNNPELVTATPLSDTQVQIAARKPGVTQINLWDEHGKIFTVDLMIFGDVRELEMALKQMFPASSLKVVRLTNSLVLEGQVDRPEIVSVIRTLAEDYAPKVINNISVGGVQQVLLKVKVMEVSRTKLRKMGSDFAIFGQNGFAVSSVSGIINSFNSAGQTASAPIANSGITFGVIDNGTTFLSFLDLLQQNQVAKILADPMLVTVSGRPASFNVGGELPILVPSGLGTTTIEYKKFGTQVDFVPIVLGDGNIRLEVRPRISEIDDSRGVQLNGATVPALKVREVDTGVELKAGQTLALAGLIQERIESSTRGLPYVMDVPVLGAAFRKVQETTNEIESLILVTPEFVDGMDPHEVPQCGPGMETMSPSNGELYWKGMIEVPACGPCGAVDCNPCQPPGIRCDSNGQCSQCGSNYGPAGGGYSAMATDASMIPYGQPAAPTHMEMNSPEVAPTPADDTGPTLPGPDADGPPPDPSAENQSPAWIDASTAVARRSEAVVTPQPIPTTSTPGLIGPIGYDVEK